jgi:hypothetical protein
LSPSGSPATSRPCLPWISYSPGLELLSYPFLSSRSNQG